MQEKEIIHETNILFKELSELINNSKSQLISSVNSTMTMLFWNVGTKINVKIMNHQRGDYGKKIVVTLSRQLT